MSNQKTMSWSDFGKSFGRKTLSEAKPTTFNNPLGNYFTVGKHTDVKITSVEPRATKIGPKLVFTLENEAGASITADVFLTSKDRRGVEQPSRSYQQLISSLSPSDAALAFEFHTAAVNDPELYAGLVGLYTTINVDLAKTGYLVMAVGDQFEIHDRETQQRWIGTELYDSLDAAKDTAKEMGIYRCKVEVKSFFKVTKAKEDDNQQALRAVIASGNTSGETRAPAGAPVRKASI